MKFKEGSKVWYFENGINLRGILIPGPQDAPESKVYIQPEGCSRIYFNRAVCEKGLSWDFLSDS